MVWSQVYDPLNNMWLSALVAAIPIIVLLGATQNFAPVEEASFPFNYLRGAGTTLTNFVYEASPTGNLNQPEKAYAAAFVLLLMVLALNAAVDVVHRRARKVGTWSH